MCVDEECPRRTLVLDNYDLHGPALPDHACPFAEEIDNDHETLCNCCENCMDQCGDEV